MALNGAVDTSITLRVEVWVVTRLANIEQTILAYSLLLNLRAAFLDLMQIWCTAV